MCYNCTPIKTILITSATTTATSVILVPSTPIQATDLVNLNKYRLILTCNVKPTANLPVYIQTVSGNVPLFCRYAANDIFPDQLRRRYCYTIVYGNNNVFVSLGQFVLQNKVCPTRGRGTTGTTTVTTDTPVVASVTTESVNTNAKSK